MRLRAIFQPSDHPDFAGEGPDGEVRKLFDYLCPGSDAPKLDTGHAGLAILAHNPAMARHFAALTRFMVLETGWAKHQDLRELAIQSINRHFKSGFSWQARLPHAPAAGISAAQLEAIGDWRTGDLFNDEQRLVLEYTEAVVTGVIPDALFQRVVDHFGEREAVEFTTLIGVWSAWAMIINAGQPAFD